MSDGLVLALAVFAQFWLGTLLDSAVTAIQSAPTSQWSTAKRRASAVGLVALIALNSAPIVAVWAWGRV